MGGMAPDRLPILETVQAKVKRKAGLFIAI